MAKKKSDKRAIRTIAKPLEPVTFDVLKFGSSLANPICFGISELALADLFHKTDLGETELAPLIGDLRFRVRSLPFEQESVRVKFDASRNEVALLDVPFLLVVEDEPSRIVGTKFFQISIFAYPSIGKTNITNFDLVFTRAEITAEDDAGILNQSAVLKQYPTIDAFNQALRDIADQITKAQGGFEFFLPSIVSSLPLPDYWDQIEGFQLSFDKFEYRDVFDEEIGLVGYLFIIFGVRSLNLPGGCFCPEDQPVRKIQEPVPPSNIVLSVGISQDALREILSSYLTSSGTTVVRSGGTAYGYIRGWVKTEQDSVLIQDEYIEVKASVSAGGEAKIGIKNKCTGKVEFGPGVKVSVEDVKATGTFFVTEAPASDDPTVVIQTLTVSFLPRLGTVSVDVEILDPATNLIASILGGLFANFIKDFLNKAIIFGKITGLFSAATDIDQAFVGFKFVEGYPVYRKNEALAIMLEPSLPPKAGLRKKKKNSSRKTIKKKTKKSKSEKSKKIKVKSKAKKRR